MMTSWPKLAGSYLIATLLSSQVFAASPTPAQLSGSIAGYVRDSTHVPQMGASVLLFNRYEKLIYQTITNERGIFGFDALAPDVYSVRVTLASYFPAVKRSIAVQPGMQSLLYVDMASVLSSIELVYVAPGQGALMSDDWKRALKAAYSTRPILRALPEISASDPDKRDRPVNSIFSDTRGVLKVSAGDPGSLGSLSSQSDLGTAFAVATSVFGRNQVQVSGNFGYSTHAGLPAAGFRTSFSREGLGPEVAITMQQVYLPARQSDGAPALRNLAFSVRDSLPLGDDLRLDYGVALDSISFLDHLNYLSKFAKLSYAVGSMGTLELAYSSGAPPVDLYARKEGLAADFAALSALPRLSLLDGRTTVQRSQDFELGYEKRLGSTTFNLTGYRETVTNASLTISAPGEVFAADDILPDISARSSILNAGSYQRLGYAASVTQALGDRLEFGSSFGRGGALELSQQDLALGTADELRSKIHTTQRFWASARAAAKLPLTGTEVSGSYQWTDYTNALMPAHFYLTQRAYPEIGLNIRLRQPIPPLFGMPGRLEATAELRNGLAQGYTPVTENGQRVLLMQTPRALRGGLSFIF